MTCPHCGSPMQQEDDGVSQYRLCRICGFMQHLDRSGAVYAPPPEKPPAHGALHNQHVEESNPFLDTREFQDGCKHSPSCFTCPLPECIYDGNHHGKARAFLEAQRRLLWFGGKTEGITAADVRAEMVRSGCTERSAWRRAQRLRDEAALSHSP